MHENYCQLCGFDKIKKAVAYFMVYVLRRKLLKMHENDYHFFGAFEKIKKAAA